MGVKYIMKNLSARKLRRLFRKNKAIMLAMVAVLAIGIGVFVAKVFAAPNITISTDSLSLSGGAYNLTSTTPNHTFSASIHGLDLSGSSTWPVITWSSTNTDVVTVAAGTAGTNPSYNGELTSHSAGYATIRAEAPAVSGQEITAGSINVFVPIDTALTVNGSDASGGIFAPGTTFTLKAPNVGPTNPLVYHFYRAGSGSDGAEITSANGLGEDIVITSTSGQYDKTHPLTFQINKGGVYKIEVCTSDYVNNTSANKIPELKMEYTVNIKTEFTTGIPSPAPQVDFVEIKTTTAGLKYAVVDDITKPYALLSNMSIHGAPGKYGVMWQSGATDIATVVEASGNGVYNMVQGVHAGVAPITMGIKSVDITGTTFITEASKDVCYVIVPFIWGMDDVGTNSDGTATIDIRMNVNDSYRLSTSGKNVSWSYVSPTNAQANITSDGVFTPTEKGDYTVSAHLVNPPETNNAEWQALLATRDLYINIHVIDSFGLSEDTHTLYVDDEFDLKALVTDENVPVTFTYEQQVVPGTVPSATPLVSITPYVPDGGTVATAAKIKGLKSGYAKITASQTVNGITKSASCLVTVVDGVRTLAIDPPSLTLDCGTAATLNVIFNGNNSIPENQTVLWTSSNSEVLSVTPNGNGISADIVANANKGGDVTIMVVSQDGLYSAVCNVHVRKPVTGVTLNRTEVTGALKDEQFQLVATVLPEGDGVNRKVKWSSTNPSVVTVDSNGLVKYVGTGYASIICETEDLGADGEGFKAFCNFYINVPVESLVLDVPQEIIMSINEEKRITAEVLPITASQRTISWESSNTSICTVDSNGLVKAIGHGNAVILAKTIDGSGLTAMTNVYVKQPVEKVILNTNEITVRKGAEFWLNATCLPESADNKICSWTSSNEEVCKVEQDGKVTAVGSGTCNIVVTNDDTGISDFCVVTVTQPVTGLTLNSDYQLMWVGAKYAIIPNVLPVDADNKKVTYQSSDETVATVDEDGIVTALKGGNCVIIVTTDEMHLKASVTIEVKEYVSSIKLSENEKFMNVGSTGTLKATVGSDTATNKAVVWSSSNNAVATVVDGKVFAYSVGNAVITATAADGSGVSDTCLVKVVKPVESITIEPSEVRILVGDYYKLKATVSPADATVKDLRWESSNDAIATVDSDGEVVGVAVGKCKITAYSTDGNEVKGSCSVYVSPVVKISSLKVNSSEITMLVGKTRKLQAFVTPTNHTESVDWYSTDTSIVSVDSNGNITTVGPGIADVVVYGGITNIQSTCRVHSLALSKTSINMGQYDWFDLAVDGSQGYSVSWRTSNPRVATVDNTGHVVARMRGTTTITATVDNKTLTCVVNVGNLY